MHTQVDLFGCCLPSGKAIFNLLMEDGHNDAQWLLNFCRNIVDFISNKLNASVSLI
uniref:Uncharacterized protein n=1 Tax=Rhizophora mucronata TaxID=61149 RepID=A0A2P2NLB3_RHIMU